MPKLSEFLFGKKDKIKKVDTLTPQQNDLIALINQGLTSGEGPFGDLFGNFDENKFNKGVVNPALKNFQEQILPQIQEKFISGNQVLGSGMRNAQIRAGTDLQEKLAQLMYQAQQQQGQNKLQGVNQVLGTKAFENIYRPGTTGAVQSTLQGVGQGVGQAAGAAVAG